MISTHFRPMSLPVSFNAAPKSQAKTYFYAHQSPAFSGDSMDLRFRGATKTDHEIDPKTMDPGYKLLCQAARAGDVESARVQLKSGTPVEKAVEGHDTPAEIAAQRGHADLLELLLTGKVIHGLAFVPSLKSDIQLANPLRTNKEGRTLFHQLAVGPYKAKRNVNDIINTAKVIARAGVDDQRNHEGLTALQLAVDGNNPHAVKALLLAGANPTIVLPNLGATLLEYAEERGIKEIVRDLKVHIKDLEDYEVL